jgi:hypothetical protein
MAEERFPRGRLDSMSATTLDTDARRASAISRKHVQNGSSKDTLVLCPAMTIERFTIGDFTRLPST